MVSPSYLRWSDTLLVQLALLLTTLSSHLQQEEEWLRSSDIIIKIIAVLSTESPVGPVVAQHWGRGGDGNWTEAKMINFNFNEIFSPVGINYSLKGIANVSSRGGNCEKSVMWFIQVILTQSSGKIIFNIFNPHSRSDRGWNHKNSELNSELFLNIWTVSAYSGWFLYLAQAPLSSTELHWAPLVGALAALQINLFLSRPPCRLPARSRGGFYQQMMEFIEKSWVRLLNISGTDSESRILHTTPTTAGIGRLLPRYEIFLWLS